ncbi:hypothetical protein C1H46_023436 [Malus baccata]|uniref:Uncharacterized protein n=1 Tax=Malus baccata TaxID=106549 RepID=A0A540LX47_MALBA|nr:hypothetical protein C1H46_023436 [Malus baccata]
MIAEPQEDLTGLGLGHGGGDDVSGRRYEDFHFAVIMTAPTIMDSIGGNAGNGKLVSRGGAGACVLIHIDGPGPELDLNSVQVVVRDQTMVLEWLRIFGRNYYAVSPKIVIRRFLDIRFIGLKGQPQCAHFNLFPQGWGGTCTPGSPSLLPIAGFSLLGSRCILHHLQWYIIIETLLSIPMQTLFHNSIFSSSHEHALTYMIE